MADLTLTTSAGDLAVLQADLVLPGYGLWMADLLVESSEEGAVSGLATLSLKGEATSRTLKGFIALSSVFAGRTQARLIGCQGGLVLPVQAKYYQKINAQALLVDLLGEVGESLDSASEVNVEIQKWARRAALASACLKDIVEHLGTSWRATDEGKILVGDIEPVAYSREIAILSDDPIRQRWEIDLAEVDLSPGMTLEERPIDRVEYCFTPDTTRVFVRVGI